MLQAPSLFFFKDLEPLASTDAADHTTPATLAWRPRAGQRIFLSKIFWFSQRCSMTHHVPLIDLKFKVSYNLYTVYTSTCTEGFLIHCCILLHCRYRYHWTAMKFYGGTRVPVTSPRQKAISRLVSATNTLGSWLRRLISSPKDWNLLRPQDFRYMQQAPSCKICWVCWFNVKTNRLVDGYWLTFKVNV